MRRWNGWGEETVDFPFPPAAVNLLRELVGEGTPPPGVELKEVLAVIPPSPLPPHPLINTDKEVRLRHSRGQSLPDWIALRSGRIGRTADGVAFPTSNEEVRALLDFARTHKIKVIPYGGGTSVVGHLTPLGEEPVLIVALSRMNRLLTLDEVSHLATFQAGVSGPALEKQLNERGYTLGHYPQSFEYSTLGGWVATRSSGQFSLGYGKIERLFAGGRIESPQGSLIIPPLPASAAGPDLRELVLGSEGRFGIITEVTVRVRRRPEKEYYGGCFLPDFDSGMAAVQELVRQRLPLTMLRLSDALETAVSLSLSGNGPAVQLLEKFLRWRGIGAEKCLLLYGTAGSAAEVAFARRVVAAVVRRYGGVSVGSKPGASWYRNRFRLPYLRNNLWDAGYAVDTLETAVPWSKAGKLARELVAALTDGLKSFGERVLAYSHISHVYTDGCSIYVTYLFRLAPDPEENLKRWTVLKQRASSIIVDHGGTISHQHGVGIDHKEYLAAEKGPLGMAALKQVASFFDPDCIMNPGKML